MSHSKWQQLNVVQDGAYVTIKINEWITCGLVNGEYIEVGWPISLSMHLVFSVYIFVYTSNISDVEQFQLYRFILRFRLTHFESLWPS